MNSALKAPIRYSKQRHKSATKQRGVVLFVALIVLVAMTLAGVSMMRATGTGTQVAGNLAARQNAIQAPDAAFENALGQIVAMVNAGTTNQAGAIAGYSNIEVSQSVEQRNWPNAQNLGTNALTGNRVDILIDRLCTPTGPGLFDCESTMGIPTNAEGNGNANPGLPHIQPYRHFRTIARVTDPKGKTTFVEFKND